MTEKIEEYVVKVLGINKVIDEQVLTAEFEINVYNILIICCCTNFIQSNARAQSY